MQIQGNALHLHLCKVDTCRRKGEELCALVKCLNEGVILIIQLFPNLK